MSGHTPGPWKAQKDIRSFRNDGVFTDGPFTWGIYADGMRIANMTEAFDWNPEEKIEANARLIADAPKTKEQRDDMLAALKYIAAIPGGTQTLDDLENVNGINDGRDRGIRLRGAVEVALEEIAKAEGRES